MRPLFIEAPIKKALRKKRFFVLRIGDRGGDDFLFLDGLVHEAGFGVFNFLHYIVAFDDFAEDCVAHVQPGGEGGRDEELAAVGVGAGVRHGEYAFFAERHVGAEFVFEGLAPD